jgi:hypothetical protein
MGGTWTGTWPAGTGPAHYDYFSPIMVKWDSQTWVDSSHTTWADTCINALRQGILWSRRNKSADGLLDMVMCDSALYYGLLTAIGAKESIQVQRGQKSALVALGFNDVVNLDGVDITWEYGMTANKALGFNVNHMGLRSLQSQLFVPEGPDYDFASKQYRFSVDHFGNAWFRPRYFVEWYNYST